MKNILISFLCIFVGSVSAQTDTAGWSFLIDYSKDPGMKVPTFEDSCLIDELAFDKPVIKAFMFKFSEDNFIITLKFKKFDEVFIFQDGYLEDVYEIGEKYFRHVPLCEF
jgi:hypothetical protein